MGSILAKFAGAPYLKYLTDINLRLSKILQMERNVEQM